MADTGGEKGAKAQLNPVASGLGSGGDIDGQVNGIPVAIAGKEKLGLRPTGLDYITAVRTSTNAADRWMFNSP